MSEVAILLLIAMIAIAVGVALTLIFKTKAPKDGRE